MATVRAVQATAAGGEAPRRLYDRIGKFLVEQRLEPDPANYAFAFHLLGDPNGPLALAVKALTEGGFRLTQKDIESLGCEVKPVANGAEATERAQGLVAQTQMQVEGFEDIVQAMRAETEGFGRDLAASAEAITRSAGGNDGIDEITRITLAMVERVRSAESRLDSVTREASELRMKLEEARDNARRDPLTNLPNRRAFEESYTAQVAAGTPLCVAICDVDHFKSVNDRFGHAVGDRVLKSIAEALSETCNEHLVARYGGEEFVVLFSGVDLNAALDTLDAARASVEAKRYRLRETDAPLGAVTFSAGLTRVGAEDRYHHVYQRADKLLYAAKEAGRNCIRVE